MSEIAISIGSKIKRDGLSETVQLGDALLLQTALKASRRKSTIIFACQFGLLVLLLLAWQVCSGRLISASTISSPSQVARLGYHWLKNGYLLSNMAITLEEVLLGFAIGVSAGIATGILLGMSTFASRVLSPYVNVMYALPKIALGPLFIVWFGIAMELKVVLAALFVYFIILYNTWTGVRQVDADLVNVLRVMGASRTVIVRKAMLPSALVWVVLGLRISFPQALIGAIIGELLASNHGLGFIINESSQQYDVAGVLVAIIALVCIAALFDRLVALLQIVFSKRFGETSF